MTPLPPDVHTAIIGAGFAGMGVAIALDRAGNRDWVILERAGDVGGTWRDNQYPGCACDVQSHLYSYSFALNPDWSRSYSRQPEIWSYLQRIALRYDLRGRTRFGTEVLGAVWNEDEKRWEVETTVGTLRARVLVMASGALSDPAIPALPGIERFEGRVFHSAAWDHDLDLTGRRVAVIGTGASAIQFVPRIQPMVARLHLFQRTPPWVVPRIDHRVPRGARWVYRHVPGAQRAVRALIFAARELLVIGFRHRVVGRLVERAARRHLIRQVRDPQLRRALTPDYAIGCKRILLSNDYYPALTRENVGVVTAGVREVRSHAIVDGTGMERPVDVIIFGTGFQPTEPPLAAHVRGRDGRTLAEHWGGSPRAFAGTTVSGFPNFFVFPGPGTGLGHNSVIYMLEAQIEHMLGVLHLMESRQASAIEPVAEAQERYVRELDERMRGTVWVSGGCRSWYLDGTGRNSTLWPDFSFRFRRRVATVDPGDYVTSTKGSSALMENAASA